MRGSFLGVRLGCAAIAALVVMACGGGGGATHNILEKDFHLNVFNNSAQNVVFRINSLDYPVSAGNHTNGNWHVTYEKTTSKDIIFVEARTPAGASLKSNSFTLDYATANNPANDTLDINFTGTDITYNVE